ncbi:hypothetical protein J4T87_0028565 (plasmid) [Rhizobium sp. T1473]|uniref:hypothetical protein n=1 Tax=Rhizobium sp. T1473 TaxID=555321 RepID=UPI00296EE114|nr:hypothetical protein [Rhizobium sp. T1473]
MGKPPSATAIRAALLARVRLTNRASQSHEQAILKHQDVPEAIRMRRPDAAGPAIEQLIGVWATSADATASDKLFAAVWNICATC